MRNTTIGKRPLLAGGAALVGAVALALSGAAGAHAHVGASPSTNEAGAYTVVTVSVPHGCGTSPTTEVAIQIPEGINAVTPTRNPFYTVEKVQEALDTPITDGHGNEITERVAEVVYTATTPLPADQRDAFELSLQLPEGAAGETLYFPSVQTCEAGESAWVQIPVEGQDPHELELPAPGFEVVAASGGGHDHGDAETVAGADAVEAAGAAAEHDAGTTAGGDQTPLVITSLVIGGLGLIAGIAALLRGRKQA